MRPLVLRAAITASVVLTLILLTLSVSDGVYSDRGSTVPNEAFMVGAMIRVADGEPGWMPAELAGLGAFTRETFMGIHVVRTSAWRRGGVYVVPPAWLSLLVTLASFFGLWRCARVIVHEVKRGRRTANAHCAACGYDLRATPERCPECGAAARARSV